MKKQAGILSIFVPAAVALLVGLFMLTPGFLRSEYGLYDLMLRIKPAVPEREEILLLNVDDLAIERVGVWPWSRHIMADGLVVMKEFDAAYAIFDIEYTEESPLGVNSSVLNQQIPSLLNREFGEIGQNARDLFQAIEVGAIPLEEAGDFVNDLSDLNEQSRREILQAIDEIARDNDDYLGRAAGIFEKAFFTVGMRPQEDETVSAEHLETAQAVAGIDGVVEQAPPHHVAPGMRPAIQPILGRAAGAGFPNVEIDVDGVRRRVALLYEHNDVYYGQLATAPLLDRLDPVSIEIRRNTLLLREAKVPVRREAADGDTDGEADVTQGGAAEDAAVEVRDVRIPLTPEGHLVVNWPPKTFEESFNHLSYYYVVLHDTQEEDLIHNVRIMDDAGYTNLMDDGRQILQAYDYAQSLRQDMFDAAAPTDMEEYRQVREYAFGLIGTLLEGGAEEELLSQIDGLLASPDIDEATAEEYRAIRAEAVDLFGFTKSIYDAFMETRSILREDLPGSVAFIGWTGTSTTDRGVNPFESAYDNVGTHASVYNTIIQDRFLQAPPEWLGLVAMILLAFLVWFLLRNREPVPSIAVGIASMVVIFAVTAVVFVTTGVYLPAFGPLLGVGLTFVALTIIKFFATAQERSYIRSAFGHYLSQDVIAELLDDPSKLDLGGEKRELTAIFTDVKGFSSISEALDPTELVHLLNEYLTAMSDTILDLRGTIDKYEGDAIISFFGAPISFSDHAERACKAAVTMKRIEKDLNEHFVGNHRTPNPLHTRIGINTGEMVVGNMGTTRKMDYTIMGHNVNLAARLEGVNKQYGTWILASEATRGAAGDDLVYRKLDRVRVVGVTEPVRLFEVVEEKGQIDAKSVESIEAFHEGLDHFENQEWTPAKKFFTEAARADEAHAAPAELYSKRCDKYIAEPPPKNWDGVFSLTQK